MRLLRRLRYLIHRNRLEQELAEELDYHRSLAEQEHREDGQTPEMARDTASRRLGNTTLAREAAHGIWIPGAIEGLFQDIFYAFRGFRRSKATLAVACLSLGLSTGFGTALFSVVNASLLQPLTAGRPGELLKLWVGNGNRISYPNLHAICDETPAVTCAGYNMEELMWYESGQPVLLRGQAVSPHYFSMLSITAGQGRVFTRESVKQAPESIVVTHLFWERRLGADPNVIGRKLLLTGRPYTITAVLPQGFRSIWGIGIAPTIYLPAGTPLRNPSLRYEMLAMPAPGQTLAELRSRVLVKAKDLEASEPKENEGLARVQTFPVHRFGLLWSSGGSMLKALVLFASVLTFFALLLAVVASVNVAGLLVARAMARQREIAIRISIGCGKMRLARLLLVESLVLALSGVGAGALLSLWISRVLVAMPLPFPVPIELDVPVDLHLFAYLALLTGIATVVTGFAPVLQAWRVSVASGGSHGSAAC